MVPIRPAVTYQFQTPGFGDDPFEQPPDGPVVEGTAVDARHVLEHVRFPGRLIQLNPCRLLGAANLEGAGGSGGQQPHDLLVQLVDPLPQGFDDV
jgi:hypothetical protein